ncbi:MAG: hypothetical protein ACOC3V_04375 [bacterium]
MNEHEAYDFAIKIFEDNEGRKMEHGSGSLSKDEVAVACIQIGILQTLKKYNLLIP